MIERTQDSNFWAKRVEGKAKGLSSQPNGFQVPCGSLIPGRAISVLMLELSTRVFRCFSPTVFHPAIKTDTSFGMYWFFSKVC